MVAGEGRPYLVALAVLDHDAWQALARQLGLPGDAPGALQRPEVRDAILRRAQAQLHAFPACARVRALWATLEPWTTANGLLTPTLKIRPTQLQERFAPQLEQLYAAETTSTASGVTQDSLRQPGD